MKGFAFAFVVGGCWLGAVGCSSDSGPENRADFLSELCAEYMGCCQAAGRPADGRTCQDALGSLLPGSGYDSGAAKACLDGERAKATSCDGSYTLSASCDKVFGGQGKAAPGEACETYADCAIPDAGMTRCFDPLLEGGTGNRCQVELPGKEGDAPCFGNKEGYGITLYANADKTTGYICDRAEKLVCNLNSGACERLAKIGGTCDDSSHCEDDAFCESNTGLCEARRSRGMPCITEAQCETTDYCQEDICVSRRADGEACQFGSQCQSNDCGGSVCLPRNRFELDYFCGGG